MKRTRSRIAVLALLSAGAAASAALWATGYLAHWDWRCDSPQLARDSSFWVWSLMHTEGWLSGRNEAPVGRVRGRIATTKWSECCRLAVLCGRGDLELAYFAVIPRSHPFQPLDLSFYRYALKRCRESDYGRLTEDGMTSEEQGFRARNQFLITTARMPLWPATIGFAALPVLCLIRGPLRRALRRRHGLCVSCGYNLTGNTSGVCPECGAVTEGRMQPEGLR
jgi:hypothetical protein